MRRATRARPLCFARFAPNGIRRTQSFPHFPHPLSTRFCYWRGQLPSPNTIVRARTTVGAWLKAYFGERHTTKHAARTLSRKQSTVRSWINGTKLPNVEALFDMNELFQGNFILDVFKHSAVAGDGIFSTKRRLRTVIAELRLLLDDLESLERSLPEEFTDPNPARPIHPVADEVEYQPPRKAVG